MKKRIVIAIAAFVASVSVSAQTVQDAVRYSTLSYVGSTARSAGMAGAFGALGGDFLSLATNPAGIAVYRSGELSFTPSVYNANTSSEFLGNKTSESASKFNIGNIGLVIPFDAGEGAQRYGFKMFHFGVGINRTGNYRRNIYGKGYNGDNSITTGWVDYLNSVNPNIRFDDEGNPIIYGLDSYSTKLAWNTNLIFTYTDPSSNQTHLLSDMYGGQVNQAVRLNTYGSSNEYDMTFGFNWNDVIYFGTTMGVPYFSYNEKYLLTETDATETGHDYFNKMSYSTDLQTNGSGINLKFGAIIKPVQFLRIGLAYHTPSWYNLKDKYFAAIDANLDLNGNRNYQVYTDDAELFYEYKLKTPARYMASLGLVIGQIGMIGAEYQYVDYTTAKFSSKEDIYADDVFENTNSDILNSLKATSTFRFGTEWAIGIFRIRGGYSFGTSPYIAKSDLDDQTETFSVGAGLRFENFLLDFGYARTKEYGYFYPYTVYYPSPNVRSVYKYDQYQLTLGFRF